MPERPYPPKGASVRITAALISAYTTWFIDEVIESGDCDLAEVIGVPSIVTVDWLGLPVRDWHRYARLHRDGRAPESAKSSAGTPRPPSAASLGAR